MGESGGGHLTASLCVLLAQVVIVVILLMVVMLVKMAIMLVMVIFVLWTTMRIYTTHVLLAQVMIVVINCDCGQDSDDVW